MTHLLKTAIVGPQTDATLGLVTCWKTSGRGPGHHDGTFSTTITNEKPDAKYLADCASNGYELKVERIDCVLITVGRFTFLAPLSHVVLDMPNDHTVALAQCGLPRTA